MMFTRKWDSAHLQRRHGLAPPLVEFRRDPFAVGELALEIAAHRVGEGRHP